MVQPTMDGVCEHHLTNMTFPTDMPRAHPDLSLIQALDSKSHRLTFVNNYQSSQKDMDLKFTSTSYRLCDFSHSLSRAQVPSSVRWRW